MKGAFDFIARIMLSIFLTATHAKLFYWLDPIFIDEEMQKFSFTNINEKTLQAMIFAFLFGIMTVYVLERKKTSPLFLYFVISIALLDGIIVQLQFNIEIKGEFRMIFASIHYSLYTVFIILMFGFSGNKEKQQKKHSNITFQKQSNSRGKNNADVIKMLEDGKTIPEISEIIGLNKSTVYRIKNKHYDGQK